MIAYNSNNIIIKNLNINFITSSAHVRAIRDLSIDFPGGQITGIVGESGSGKSVLGLSVLQLLPPNAVVTGTCMYQGKNLYQLTEKEIRHIRSREIGLIPQNPILSLNPVLTVGRQLKEALIKHLNKSDQEAQEQCIEYLKAFGFSSPERIMKSYSFQLSGGMNQRIVAIMGLVCKPNWVIADEPTKGLDAVLRKSVYEVLVEIHRNYIPSMILITHDLYFAKKICHQIGVMYQGEIVEMGKATDVFSSPCHPYTRGLIQSTPQNGMVPIPLAQPKKGNSACRFFNRCSYSVERCLSGYVIKKTFRDGRVVRCNLYA